MHTNIGYNLKRRFHATGALRGRKMSQVVTELIEQWLQHNEYHHFLMTENNLY
ncbi:hypothetical protein [Calothrix rhizosoleniae]|uniref:hypothetical protein n=1 Tax=Calothrix rhizosoleniae TaxID=888997 RepID=UPI00190E68D6|nr:hypothetical protein [Calothrix rhizosoleniae]